MFASVSSSGARRGAPCRFGAASRPPRRACRPARAARSRSGDLGPRGRRSGRDLQRRRRLRVGDRERRRLGRLEHAGRRSSPGHPCSGAVSTKICQRCGSRGRGQRGSPRAARAARSCCRRGSARRSGRARVDDRQRRRDDHQQRKAEPRADAPEWASRDREAVAGAAHGLQVPRLARVRLQLLPQVAHVDVDRARLAVVRAAPERLEQRCREKTTPGSRPGCGGARTPRR